MEIIQLHNYLQSVNQQILDTQAEIDDFELFGGNPEKETRLRDDLTLLQDEKAGILQSLQSVSEPGNGIVLQTGEAISATQTGGWGRLHYVSRAMGSRKRKTDYWVCGHCQERIEKGQEHYRRSYYLDKSDCRSGRQIRLCLECYAEHQEQHPPNTTFPVYRPAKAKTVEAKAA